MGVTVLTQNEVREQCYCKYLAVCSIACEGHVLEFCSSYECKSSSLGYLDGPSNTVFCL